MDRVERDLVLSPNEYAFILDETKGNINTYVGPTKVSLANTDKPVIFDDASKRFLRVSLEKAVQGFAIAPEGWYITLKNPAEDTGHPTQGTVSGAAKLNVGHKINVPGPVSFPLWPGQMARTLQGHRLRSNNFLIARVYDEQAAKNNWNQQILKAKDGSEAQVVTDIPELQTGQLIVIKGTDVAFYIPPTGVEVLRDSKGTYVRDAVTLERLEYCVLKDENGNKRYVRGPDVVFPSPTETFVSKNDARKFKAVELNEISGLYIKVIADYTENGESYKVGDELFITGREQMIYFPREEHAIIKYGDQDIHYATAIPEGEARYVLDRLSGSIRLIRGPEMYLPDPRKELIVRRILEPKQVSLWFPGNNEAKVVNDMLRETLGPGKSQGFTTKRDFDRLTGVSSGSVSSTINGGGYSTVNYAADLDKVSNEVSADDFQRKRRVTPPKVITLDTKYEGAVAIDIWTGYAVLVKSKSGNRKVIVGPQTYLLEYDEILESMALSTGKPKTTDNLHKTVYLRVKNNKVSDVVNVETKDLVDATVKLSYRVNFEGPPESWFNVENYVQFMTQHTRSLLKNAIRRLGVEEFYQNAIDVIRDTILGVQEEGNRKGRHFSENGMHIYDVEVLDVSIANKQIGNLLVNAQHEAVSSALEKQRKNRELEMASHGEQVRQQILAITAATDDLVHSQKLREIEHETEEENRAEEKRRIIEDAWTSFELHKQQFLDKIESAARERARLSAEQDLTFRRAEAEIEKQQLEDRTQAVISRIRAVSPDLIAALQAFGDKHLLERLAETMTPFATITDTGVVEAFQRLLKNTEISEVLNGLSVNGIVDQLVNKSE